ncbi:MAG: hypothetical protein C5B58_03595 [Acidobacteria bacterium]|nr:MAG: hypothetical protein C5B58_03595 [Acidobacteriota bacterium]
MKYRKRSLMVAAFVIAVFPSLSPRTLNASDDHLAAVTFVVAQMTKQQCTSTCRARYRNCRHLNQLPLFECRSVYQDCIRWACTGAGPG